MTRKKEHKIRDPDKMRRRLIDAIGEILEKQGFTGVRVNNIARHLDRDKNLVRYYFGNIQNLKKAFIMEKDYWPPFFERFKLNELSGRVEIRQLFVELMRENYRFFKNHKEMQKIIQWQINENLSLLRHISDSRELEGEKLLVRTDKFFEGTGVSFRSVVCLLLGGIYYVVLHATTNGSKVASVDITVDEEHEALWRTIGQIIDWAFEAAEKAGGLV
ncbi:TetR/AcrR family transcriptional regulator [Mucilaginibacter sp. AK015]|uniref:TetR/AcrR family transcriptional regulator n=1 Tax=Mucilaginibacter sp. AK015 TaxID=2723072 RepID=UPI0016124F29|nr:TetR/AcrR family transcriptional regulator [Mucilaginibacter sp. AK015]MBB5396670.1 AcrR family transcriptional regulator [Mucilaginibacter sp. AK015]